MPTKTERILSYLPGTFRCAPRLSALYALADAFGSELLQAENSLAAVMQAHWVDHADRGAEVIDDLACIAALYGLAPRADEGIEEFREHLKRYVRTFLEGTVTVQGILRVTAEALGLRIADAYEEMDTWWTRADDELITVECRGDDAAELILGVRTATAVGSPARPAQVTGTVDLSDGIDLRETAILCLEVDGAGPVDIDLAAGAGDPAAVTLDEIVKAINDELDAVVATHDDHTLTLTSPTYGPSSRLEIQETSHDVAESVLGLHRRIYHGSEALAARVTGTVDLSDGVDLSAERYVRIAIDATSLAEVDCAGPDPAQTTLDQVCLAINSAFSIPDLATNDGHFLTLTSPTQSFTSSIAFQQAAAQDATVRLFGLIPSSFYTGRDALPARVSGWRDLSGGVDLSQHVKLQLRLDGGAPVAINCAGVDPVNTRPAEIVARINAAFVPDVVASHDGRFITLTSPTTGPDGEIVLETPPSDDATEAILGIAPRTFQGAAARAARLAGKLDLSSKGVDLMARRFLKMALDGGPPVEIDLRASAKDPRAVTLDELVGAINNALEPSVATHDGQHLILLSQTTGNASSLVVEPLETTRRRHFVTRAMITDEASQAVFGFTAKQAQGAPATSARVVGEADLSHGVDLREERYLRLAVDNDPAVDVDCAGKRPRATLIGEVVQAINAALEKTIAAHDERHLVLVSPSPGAESRIAFESPRAIDALDTLLGVEAGTFRGLDGTGVSFTGTVDLSDGVDLEANAAIKLGVSGMGPVEITLGDPEPSHKTLTQIVIIINGLPPLGLGPGIASHDGQHIILTSPPGPVAEGKRELIFETPSGPDATEAIFGIAPPRQYHGADALPAQVTGKRDLSAGADLHTARILRLAVDDRPVENVDCAARAADPTVATLQEIVEAINEALGDEIASHDGQYLSLRSPTAGLAGRITLEPYISADARKLLFGDVKDITEGSAPTPAIISGTVDLLTPADLSQRRLLRLVVDGGRPEDIDVAGAAPETTFLDEIVAAINAVFPSLAAATEDDRLQLTSPAVDEGSSLVLLPLRYLELIEYPPESKSTSPQIVRHGDGWSVVNDGAAEVFVEARLTAPQGVVGPTLVNATLGWHIRLLTSLAVGETARLWRDPERGLQVKIVAPNGEVRRAVPGSEILAGPLGAQARVPFDAWPLTGDNVEPATLQLNNPLSPNLVRLRARQSWAQGHAINVTATEHQFSAVNPGSIVTDGSPARLIGRVVCTDEMECRLIDADETPIALLRKGPQVELEAHRDHVAAVTGPLCAGEPPLLIVQQIVDLFDVVLRVAPEEGDLVRERYTGVTIGVGTETLDSLVWQINTRPSQLVRAEELGKGTALTLPRGKSDWIYGDCYSSRFNQADLDAAHFAGGRCDDRGVFNVSRFAHAPPEQVAAVFASSSPSSDPPTEVVFRWARHQPGAFRVNLPADLPAHFGGRFNQARFGQKKDAPELYAKAVAEPPVDEHYLVDLINVGHPDDDPPIPPSTLAKAEAVPTVPLGWAAVEMPFRKPQSLTLGDEDTAACLYLAEEGLEGFIKIQANETGAWGNEIAVTARPAGPAMYDVTIAYEGARFENARQVALGKGPMPEVPPCQKGKAKSGIKSASSDEDLPALIQDLLQPGPIGVLQAKAAGVRASVSRDRTRTSCEQQQHHSKEGMK